MSNDDFFLGVCIERAESLLLFLKIFEIIVAYPRSQTQIHILPQNESQGRSIKVVGRSGKVVVSNNKML